MDQAVLAVKNLRRFENGKPVRPVTLKFTCSNCLAHLSHELMHKEEIVIGAKHEAQNFFLFVQMANITQRIFLADSALAFAVYGRFRLRVFEIAQVNLA